MNTKKGNAKIQIITMSAVIAAAYAVLTYLQNFLLPGSVTMAVQVRVSEALTMLCCLTPAAIPGLTVGCVLANLTSLSTMPLDMVFGSIATLLACLCMYALRKVRFKGLPILSSLMPAIFNGIIIGLEITFFLGDSDKGKLIAFLTNAGLVALGEIIAVCVLGIPLEKAIEKRHLIKGN